jgi:hypothetical protein
MIYVSFPGEPDAYPARATYPPELAHHIYYGLKNKYKKVAWVKFYQPPPNFDIKKDIMVTQVFGNYSNVPRERVILVDNSNFETNKLVYADRARYTKHGVSELNEIDGNFDTNDYLVGIGNAIIISNDIAIGKYNSDHSDVITYKYYLKSNIDNIEIVPHPLDKQRYLKFFDDTFIPSTPKMLVHHAGMRKNSIQFWRMIDKMGYKEPRDYVSTPYLNKDDHNLLRAVNRTYHMIVSCSYSESGPINIMEFMYQGLLVLGHEEWWNSYGYDKTLWTYDPSKYQQMQDNVTWLMDPKNLEEMRAMRNHIVNINVNRKDNEWPHLLQKLYTMVDSLL